MTPSRSRPRSTSDGSRRRSAKGSTTRRRSHRRVRLSVSPSRARMADRSRSRSSTPARGCRRSGETRSSSGSLDGGPPGTRTRPGAGSDCSSAAASCANSGAIRLAEEHLPNVVLMDIVFKGDGMSGIDATRRIKEASPSTNVVIMTAHDDERLLVEAVEAGASGFLSKDEAAVEILAAAKAAADGAVLIDPATLTRPPAPVARQREEQRDALVLLDDLTDREREILGLLAQGKRNDDIARELYISPQTVQTHVRNILGKLRVHSKLEAVSFAVKHGAIQVG